MERRTYKTIVLDGFSQEEALAVMRAVKAVFKDPKELIFAMTTSNSRELTVKDLIADLREEHEYFLANPPGKTSSEESPVLPQNKI